MYHSTTLEIKNTVLNKSVIIHSPHQPSSYNYFGLPNISYTNSKGKLKQYKDQIS